MNQKKVILWIIIAAIIVAVIGIGICIWLIAVEAENKKLDAEAITLKENLKVEFGQEVKVSDFLQDLKGELLEDATISTETLGEVEVPIHFKNVKNRKRKLGFTIQVVDTTPPQIFSNSTYTVNVGYTKNLTDVLLSGDNADDQPKREIIGDYDFNVVGSYPLTYVVTDSSGNQTKKEFTLRVKEKTTSSTTTTAQTPKLQFADVLEKYKTEQTKVGIDVSKWQGEIDWQEVKAAGVEFAMLRIGYQTDYDGTYEIDPYFETNIQGAKKAGLPVGVYFYSYAKNVAQAKDQAKWVTEKLKGYSLELPVAYDWESWTSFNKAGMSFYTLNQCANVFLKTVEEAGYQGMLYSSKNYLETMWYKSKYLVWLAQYNTRVTYQGEYSIWQMSDKGRVNGIKGDVDLDILYWKE